MWVQILSPRLSPGGNSLSCSKQLDIPPGDSLSLVKDFVPTWFITSRSSYTHVDITGTSIGTSLFITFLCGQASIPLQCVSSLSTRQLYIQTTLASECCETWFHKQWRADISKTSESSFSETVSGGQGSKGFQTCGEAVLLLVHHGHGGWAVARDILDQTGG